MISKHKNIISKLGLIKHPEGGFFYETYRSSLIAPKELQNSSKFLERNICTAIYFLITSDNFSAFHRLSSDEIFHFYDGASVEFVQISPDGKLTSSIFGNDVLNGENPQILVQKNHWQGLRVKDDNSYALMGCTVSPGFSFEDFKMGEREYLLKEFPKLKDTIMRYTKQ